MRFLPFLLAALPLAAAMPATPGANAGELGMERRAGAKSCTKSSQCGSASRFCNRGKCDSRKKLGAQCLKDIACVSNKCAGSKCAEGAALTLGERCETSKSCASTFCGKSKCQAPQPDGASCTKGAGCTSGICTNNKCIAPTPAGPRKPISEPGNVAKNGHFENDVIAPWQFYGTVSLSGEDATAYDGTQFAILQVANGNDDVGNECAMEQFLGCRGMSGGCEKEGVGRAYAVTYQYRVPAYTAGATQTPCTLTVGFGEETFSQSGILGPPAAVTTIDKSIGQWTKASVVLSNKRTAISDLGLVLYCPDEGSSATVQLDDINFVPTAFEEADPTDLAQNGGFEQGGTGAEPWQFQNGAHVGTDSPTFGTRYAVLEAGQSISQDITISPTAPRDGYRVYEVKYRYRVASFSAGISTPATCSLYSTFPGYTFTDPETFDGTAVSTDYATFTHQVRSNSKIQNIQLNLSCEPGTTATVWIDEVQFSPVPGE